MSSHRKKTYQTYAQSRFHRRSTSSVYLAESNSTLTASSQDSADLDFDEGNWCAQKMRKQRKRMQKLVECYEQQKKCIGELEDYIDELERSISLKDDEIKRLQSNKIRENQLSSLEMNIRRQVSKDEQIEKNRMLTLINGQLRMYDLERQRWQKEVELKQQELLEEQQAFQEQLEENHKFYKDKIIKIQLKWLTVEQKLTDEITQLQKYKAELQTKNIVLTQKLSSRNQFEEMLKLRRQLSIRENQLNAHSEKKELDNNFLRQQLERAKSQIKKIKKQNCRLKNQLQTKIFDYEIQQNVASNIEARRQKSVKKSERISEDRMKADRLGDELKKVKMSLAECQQRCKQLSERNIELQNQLNSLFSERNQNEQKWSSLRKEEHQQIEHLNRLFKKIDFNI